MYDMTKITKRTFDTIFIDGKKLSILSPKLKRRYEISDLLTKSVDYLNDLSKAISLIASNNLENISYNKEDIDRLMDEDEMVEFVEKFIDWLNGVTSEKN